MDSDLHMSPGAKTSAHDPQGRNLVLQQCLVQSALGATSGLICAVPTSTGTAFRTSPPRLHRKSSWPRVGPSDHSAMPHSLELGDLLGRPRRRLTRCGYLRQKGYGATCPAKQ
jgi:hypothetical protein